MKFLNHKVEKVNQNPGIEGIFEIIEKAGRVCYKSEPKQGITSKEFVDRLIKSNHLSPLEHGTVYLSVFIGSPLEDEGYLDKTDFVRFFSKNKYSKVVHEKITSDILEAPVSYNGYRITTNYRVIIENLDDIGDWQQYLDDIPQKLHKKRHTFLVNTNIGVTREMNRHRTFSICEQSTRYCNFAKDKFGNEIAFCTLDVIPTKLQEFLQNVENFYMTSIEKGVTPEIARMLLPLCTATTAIYTAFDEDWQHYLDLRLYGSTGKPHPEIKKIAEQISLGL